MCSVLSFVSRQGSIAGILLLLKQTKNKSRALWQVFVFVPSDFDRSKTKMSDLDYIYPAYVSNE
jgi:hypothetical protein